MSQRDVEFAMLEQSAQELSVHSEKKINLLTQERDTLASKCAQLEILLRGRQQALVSKEMEVQKLAGELRQRVHKTSCSWFQGEKSIIHSRPVSLAIAPSHVHVFVEPPAADLFLPASPPKTAVRRNTLRQSLPVLSPILTSSDSSFEEPRVLRRSLPRSPVMRKPRESFASVRSDSSDTSLDRLVSSTMRLSRLSLVRSSVASSFRSSYESASSNFPRKWK